MAEAALKPAITERTLSANGPASSASGISVERRRLAPASTESRPIDARAAARIGGAAMIARWRRAAVDWQTPRHWRDYLP